MKEEILRLRAEGKTYDQIRELTGASKSTISYHCAEGQREKTAERRRKRRLDIVIRKTDSFKYNVKGVNNKFDTFNDKAPRATFSFSLQDVKDKIEDNPVCYLTGRPIDVSDPASYHFDHITPVSQGGLNTLENLGIATAEANSAKGDMDLEYFLDLCEDVLRHHKRI